MKTAVLAVVLSVCFALPASAGSLEVLTPYLSVQHFSWQERNGGRQLLKESGPLFSGGVLLGAVTDSSLTLRGKAEVFGGEVDYDGETQAPDPVPVRTEVGYFGSRQEFDLGYRISTGGLQFEPFGGAGYRWWLRRLQDGTSATGQQVSGYTEWWQTVYGRLGARGRYQLPSGLFLVAEGGAKYPFYTGNSVDFANAGTVTFRPGGEWSGFAEAGITGSRLKVVFFYEGFRFSESPQKQVSDQFFFQPASTSDILGLSLGWAFR